MYKIEFKFKPEDEVIFTREYTKYTIKKCDFCEGTGKVKIVGKNDKVIESDCPQCKVAGKFKVRKKVKDESVYEVAEVCFDGDLIYYKLAKDNIIEYEDISEDSLIAATNF